MDENIVRLSSLILCGFVMTAILIISYSFIRIYHKNPEISLSLRYTQFIANTFAFLATCTIFILFAISAEDKNIDQPNHFIIMGLANIFSNIVTIASYSIYLLRLKHTFEDSVYKISITVFMLLFSLLAIYIGVYSYINYEIMRVNFDNSELSNTDPLLNRLDTANYAVIGTEIIIHILLLTLFNGSLLKLTNRMKTSVDYVVLTGKSNTIKTTEKIETIEMSTTTSINDNPTANTHLMQSRYELNERQVQILRVVTKITILVTVSIICTIALHIGFNVGNVLEHNTQQWLVRDAQCIYCLMQILCLYLIYAVNESLYLTLCCPCNVACYCCCVCIHRFV
eukprot:484328_1